MRTREQSSDHGQKYKVSTWVIVLSIVLLIAIFLGLARREWKTNQVVGHSNYRFNLAMIAKQGGVTFVSIDPSDQSVLALTFPSDLAIRSRTSGEYSIDSLYQLGSYQGEGGKFARQKIQGFMRVPVPGYLVIEETKGRIERELRRGLIKSILLQNETSLSRFDAWLLLIRSSSYSWRLVEQEELVRAGAIADTTYHPDRLQEYVGSRLFDWGIGESRVTVAIVNASGENGLGSDMADFLSNLGMDVVMVRSMNNESELENSEWQVDNMEFAKEMAYVFENLFSFDSPKVESVPLEFRAKVLIRVGKDAKELF